MGSNFDEDGISAEDIAGLVDMQAHFNNELNGAALAEKILNDAASTAATTMAVLAARGSNEQIKFRAAAFILDHVIGKPGSQPSSNQSAPWDDLFEKVGSDGAASNRN